MAEMMDFLEDQPPDPNNVLQTPSFAQIGWMKRNVQAIGGVLLAGVCRPRGIAYPVDGQQASGRTVMVNTARVRERNARADPAGGRRGGQGLPGLRRGHRVAPPGERGGHRPAAAAGGAL